MSSFLQRFTASLVAVGLFALPVGIFAGASWALALVAVVLGAMLVHHARTLERFERWLRAPDPATMPHASGPWEEILTRLARLLRRQRQSEQRLADALERFQRATAAMPDGIVILDDLDHVEWCNPMAERHLGLDRGRDTGHQITNIVRNPSFVDYLAAETFAEPLQLRQAHGQEFALSIQLVPYGDRQKLLISRDVTRFERLETMRRDFVANVSHELRTPLTVVGGFLETLADADEPDPAMLRRALDLMHGQTRRMQRLVEDLLTLSRLESAGSQLREEDVDVSLLVRGVHHDAQSLSGGRHRITVAIEGGAWLRGNAEELRSAFGNLGSNAVRYTPENGAIAIAWAVRDGEPVFSVTDTGIGVAPEHVPRLTERFYRVDRGRSRESGGTGLGLAIVKHVLSRHQARLEIRSEPGKGSCFSIVLPAARLLPASRDDARSEAGEVFPTPA